MMDLSNTEIKRTLDEFRFFCSDELCISIRTYISLLLRWNERISLTAVTSPTEILRFHFGESIFAASVAPIVRGRLADVGSGAGFPGLPLRLARPELEVVLIESNSRKGAFLSEVMRELHLDRIRVFRGRMNELPLGSGRFDFITVRAVGKHMELLRWSRGRLNDIGKVVLWLGDDDAESVSKVPGWSWEQPQRIPGSEKRYILVGYPS